MTDKIKQVSEAVDRTLRVAEKMFNIDLSNVAVRFDLKGRCAGQAGMCLTETGRDLYMRFNSTMINGDSFDYISNDTVPHEIAHIVGWATGKFRNHGRGWKAACIALGGSGERTHNEEVIYAKGDTYRYTVTGENTVPVSSTVHRKIQRGSVYRSKLGKIHNACKVELIAQSGRRLASPIEVTAASPTQAPVTSLTKRTHISATFTKPAKKSSNAELIRAAIKHAKDAGQDQESVIAYGIAELNMKQTLAKTYTKNNWDKV